MTATALRGTEARRPERTTNPKEAWDSHVHPDVLAIARDMGVTSPRTLRHLQARYDALMADAVDNLPVGAVLTKLRRSGSVPVDRMAERITGRLAR